MHKPGPIKKLKSSAGTKQDKCLSRTAKYLLHISVAEGLFCSSLSCINLLNELCEQKAHTCCICSMAEVPATTRPGKTKQGLTPRPGLIKGSLFLASSPRLHTNPLGFEGRCRTVPGTTSSLTMSSSSLVLKRVTWPPKKGHPESASSTAATQRIRNLWQFV